MEKMYDFDDLLIEPCVVSTISSRKQINIYNNLGLLPIMTAPMDTVVDDKNFQLFLEQKITPILPRISSPTKDWVNFDFPHSYSLQQFNELFISNKIEIPEGKKVRVLIDVANGHMETLMESSMDAKKIYGDKIYLMVGNVANPITFEKYCQIGVDSVRIGIGNGGGCLTTVQTGVGYPMASLIDRCSIIKKFHQYKTEIIADGGFKKYSDIIKAIALGADYVMLGSILNKCLESAGETHKRRNSTLGGWDPVDQYSEQTRKLFDRNFELRKVFRGMSTKEVQKSLGKGDLTTSEGVIRKNNVEYTLEGWTRNFEDYLRSAMSYCGSSNLSEFRENVTFNMISTNSFKRFDK